ncbi:MAG: hypothetical protein HN580_09640 [Deltaproteobacteria bacterium]|nr:hypothetical protein [Deltaproteobacteria bacterium]MBT4092193.1 hypothetical protein [Deltaproteobacteria bacterium]MBT4266035.1 hypothetical protein [Deltaproteobacteria bacterium]MBT4642150.1 hypothetical protein [Deltaproteobacteria bacterium]MBT6499874.1 hypothetical protein [Deltaproteobacteria bacterium]
MIKKIGIVTACIIVFIVVWLINLVWDAGEFKSITPHFAGSCKQVKSIIGAEDITIHPKTGVAYISAHDRRAANARKAAKGGIYAYDTTQASPSAVLLTAGPTSDFAPHGISLYIGDAGENVLFVVNHASDKQSIEVFILLNGKLSHQKTLRDSMLISPNDIVATGPNMFYFTNDHKYRSGLMRTVEDYGQLSVSNVVYYNGSVFSEAASGFGYANGINISPDKRTVYVSTVTEGSLHVLNRDLDSGKLTPQETIELGTGLDNIEIESNGDLWIGSHPKLLTFIGHTKDPNKLSPSQVLHLSPHNNYAPEEVYLNLGDELSGSSVAAVREKRLLIGSVFEPRFLDCRMD